MNDIQTYIIQSKGLSKSYKDVDALRSLDLQVPRNSIFGFLGPNGAGKTTTIKLLLGLARPTAGTATVFGLDIVQDSVQIRKRTGYLAQDPRYYEHMTARQILHFTARFFFSGPRAELVNRIEETLHLVGLEDKADRPIKTFSGGERQRVGIAQAQVNYPDLLILDEPAASLDPQGRHDVLEVMERLRKHTTIFYSTHILSDVQRVSDTVAILNHGLLVSQGPIEDLLKSKAAPVFSLQLKGDTSLAYERVAQLPWVTSIQSTTNNGVIHWQVGVTDDSQAEARLLQTIMDDKDVTVVEFGHKKVDLEEIFLALTEGVKHDS